MQIEIEVRTWRSRFEKGKKKKKRKEKNGGGKAIRKDSCHDGFPEAATRMISSCTWKIRKMRERVGGKKMNENECA